MAIECGRDRFVHRGRVLGGGDWVRLDRSIADADVVVERNGSRGVQRRRVRRRKTEVCAASSFDARLRGTSDVLQPAPNFSRVLFPSSCLRARKGGGDASIILSFDSSDCSNRENGYPGRARRLCCSFHNRRTPVFSRVAHVLPDRRAGKWAGPRVQSSSATLEPARTARPRHCARHALSMTCSFGARRRRDARRDHAQLLLDARQYRSHRRWLHTSPRINKKNWLGSQKRNIAKLSEGYFPISEFQKTPCFGRPLPP